MLSVPLVSRHGDILGVLSTHCREPHRPEEHELRMLDLYAGHAVDAIERIRAEVDWPAKCIATGGLAALIATETKTIEATDELLTLKGLKILYQRNQP